jgi:hypothetical protein
MLLIMEDPQLSGNIKEQPTQSSVILGLGQRISDQVYHAAVADSAYADQLLQNRDKPEQLQQLLENPSHKNSESSAAISTPGLIKAAANSLLKWGKTSFTTVTDEIYHNRIGACKTCPHFINPPEDKSLLYKIAGADVHAKSICSKCGCVIKTKARLSNDTCPDADVNKPGFNRWGELVVPYK